MLALGEYKPGVSWGSYTYCVLVAALACALDLFFEKNDSILLFFPTIVLDLLRRLDRIFEGRVGLASTICCGMLTVFESQLSLYIFERHIFRR